MSLSDRINAVDFDTATASDLAVLLEQIFIYHDGRSRDGGPIIVATGVLKRFEESVRRRAAPELHDKVRGGLADLRSTIGQFDACLERLEKSSGKTRT